MKFKALFCACTLVISLTGCAPTVESIFGQIDPQVSPVQLQALQTREYEASEGEVFSSVIGAFQSYGFVIQAADRASGLVIAKTTSDATIQSFAGIIRTEWNKATAFVEKIAKNRVSVRVSIVKHVSATSDLGAQGEKEAMITNAQVYQDIFSKIEHSLFLKKNL